MSIRDGGRPIMKPIPGVAISSARKSPMDPSRVVQRRLDPNIEILGGAWMPMHTHRIATDDEKARLSVGQGDNQIEEVVVHAHLLPARRLLR